MKLNAKELRDVQEHEVEESVKQLKRNPIYLILENIYDTYNVGGLFRLADALSVEKMYLCGEMETPPNSRILKASIGTYKVVPWEYKKTAGEAIQELRGERGKGEGESAMSSRANEVKRGDLISHGYRDCFVTEEVTVPRNDSPTTVIAIEQDQRSVPYTEVEYTMPVALVVGNETFGVLPETLDAVDKIVEIPMWGVNKSLNVIVSAAIVSYHVMQQGGRGKRKR